MRMTIKPRREETLLRRYGIVENKKTIEEQHDGKYNRRQTHRSLNVWRQGAERRFVSVKTATKSNGYIDSPKRQCIIDQGYHQQGKFDR